MRFIAFGPEWAAGCEASSAVTGRIHSVESPLPDGRGSAWGRDVLPNRDRQGAAATFTTFGGLQGHRNFIEDVSSELTVRGQPAVSTGARVESALRSAWDTVGSPRGGAHRGLNITLALRERRGEVPRGDTAACPRTDRRPRLQWIF